MSSKGRHGWTKMDTFRLRGKNWRDSGYRSKFYGTHQRCSHSGWIWKGHVGSKNSENHKKSKNPASQQVWRRKIICLRKCKDQDDRIGKIYRFQTSLYQFPLKNILKTKDRVTNQVLSLPLIGQSAICRSSFCSPCQNNGSHSMIYDTRCVVSVIAHCLLALLSVCLVRRGAGGRNHGCDSN